MKKVDLGQSLQILANIGVFIGVLLLVYELRQNTLVTKFAAANTYASEFGDLELFIVGTPGFAELVLRANQGDKLTDADELRMTVFYRRALRDWQNMHYQYLSGVLEEALWAPQLQGIAGIIQSSKGLQEHWRREKDTLSAAFNELMNEIMDERSARSVPQPD